jgi:predicted HD phosphohydrolase
MSVVFVKHHDMKSYGGVEVKFHAIRGEWSSSCPGCSTNWIVVCLAHTMKAYRGSRGIVPLIPNLSTSWK